MGRQRPRLQSSAELIEQPAKDEGQRLKQRHGIFQLHDFFKMKRRFVRDQRAAGPSACQLLQAQPRLSQALGELQSRQRRQRLECTHAPAIQCFKNFRRRREHVHRQAAQALRFLAGRDEGYSPKAARRMNRGIGI